MANIPAGIPANISALVSTYLPQALAMGQAARAGTYDKEADIVDTVEGVDEYGRRGAITETVSATVDCVLYQGSGEDEAIQAGEPVATSIWRALMPLGTVVQDTSRVRIFNKVGGARTGAGRIFEVTGQTTDESNTLGLKVFLTDTRGVSAGLGGSVPNVSNGSTTITASGPLTQPVPKFYTVYVDTTAGPIDSVLWAATGSMGQYTFVNVGTSPATITPPQGTTISAGAGAYTLAPGESVTISDYKPGRFINMTSFKTPTAAARITEVNSPAQSSSGTPLAVPAANIDRYVIRNTLAAARTDFLFSANQGGKQLTVVLVNDGASTFNWTITPAAGETFTTTAQGAAQATLVLQPGESAEVVNASNTVWEII